MDKKTNAERYKRFVTTYKKAYSSGLKEVVHKAAQKLWNDVKNSDEKYNQALLKLKAKAAANQKKTLTWWAKSPEAKEKHHPTTPEITVRSSADVASTSVDLTETTNPVCEEVSHISTSQETVSSLSSGPLEEIPAQPSAIFITRSTPAPDLLRKNINTFESKL